MESQSRKRCQSKLNTIQHILKVSYFQKDFLFFFPFFQKKGTKNFYPSRIGQKFKFSSSFFGRIEDTKISFRDYLTFTQAWLPTIIQGQNYCVHSRGLFCIQLCWVFLNKNGWSLGVCSMLLKGSFCSLLHIVGVCVKVIYPKYSKH